MPAPTVTQLAPPPLSYPDGPDGILRPAALVSWTGGTGPFDVLHEWDTVNTFDSGALVQDSNTGVTSPDTGVPPSDLGAGTWYYRATVTDTSDSAFTVTPVVELTYYDPIDQRRFLHQLANVGVAFDPTDVTTPGPDDDEYAADGLVISFRRFLHQLANVGVGFDPTDATAWGPDGSPADGETIDFRRYLHLLANITSDTPTPHVWYVFPNFGREGWEFRIVGYGFGDTQGEYSGSATLNGLGLAVISWEVVAETSSNLGIRPLENVAEPIHQVIRTVVPDGASSGLVIVCTDGP